MASTQLAGSSSVGDSSMCVLPRGVPYASGRFKQSPAWTTSEGYDAFPPDKHSRLRRAMDSFVRSERRWLRLTSEMLLTVGPEQADEVAVEVRSTTRVPLAACENISFQRGEAVASVRLEEGHAQFPLATLSNAFSGGSERTTARFCGRVMIIGFPEQELFTQLEQNIRRIGSTDSSGGEDTTHEDQASEPRAQASAIRAHLDAESAMLHACAGVTGPLRILATWDESGGVTVALDGADSAINECIQAGAPWAALELGAAGSLIHVVRETVGDEI